MKENPKAKTVFLLGPTASGKTAVSLELARRFPVEIVSVDSAQVYRYMDVGTAKPSAAERAAVPHHLVDIIDPTQAYSAARFRADALALIEEITARGRLPVLAGGTMLYFKALQSGLSDLPEADARIRTELEREGREKGWPAMHAELARIDPVAAARLKPNDSQRVQRALEVFRITGRPMSELQGRRDATDTRVDALKIALAPGDRAVLHDRIARRFDAMLANGLVDEVKSLRERFELGPELPSMRCVGYRQAWQYLEGEASGKELRERGVAATRQLAKRQLTWLRGMDDLQTFDCLRPDLAGAVADSVASFAKL
jgi:tRNA dimethylallyltransferase